MAKRRVSKVDDYVRDWAECTGVTLRLSEGQVRLVDAETGTTLGIGETVARAVDASISGGKAGEKEQALRMLGALSFGGEVLVNSVLELWDDDEDEEEDEEEEEEDD